MGTGGLPVEMQVFWATFGVVVGCLFGCLFVYFWFEENRHMSITAELQILQDFSGIYLLVFSEREFWGLAGSVLFLGYPVYRLAADPWRIRSDGAFEFFNEVGRFTVLRAELLQIFFLNYWCSVVSVVFFCG